jgi:lysophospholipase L1-like esterase
MTWVRLPGMTIHSAFTRSSGKFLPVLLLSASALFAGNDQDFTYLALGDSVAFGLDVRLLSNQPPPPPSAFVGYPETVAAVEHLLASKKEVNAACPGETSASFIKVPTPTDPIDYGCHSNGPQGQPPYKAFFGLHTDYPGSQLSFAVSELSTNKHINLVTLGIGSNDVLLLLAQCGTDNTCVNNGIQGVLNAYGQNLAQILTAIRVQAGYNGTLILVKYYSPTIALNSIAVALNSVMATVGSQFGARFADGFTAFQIASGPFGGDPCKAGLLIHLSATTCDIHPSPIGRDLLAATVILAQAGVQ